MGAAPRKRRSHQSDCVEHSGSQRRMQGHRSLFRKDRMKRTNLDVFVLILTQS